MSVPATTKAVVIQEVGKAKVQEVSTPALRPAYMLVKVSAVAINPTDWKHVDFDILAKHGARVGCDYVGTVVQVGDKVTKNFKPGDRVAGAAHGSNQNNLEDGAFAEYIVVRGDIQVKVPDNVSDEEAATWGVTIATVGQGLYQALGLTIPSKVSSPSGEPVFIYGGSTATGIGGIQYAKASGYKVITTASPKHHEYLKSIGADVVVDYHSPTCGADIRKMTDNKLTKAWDCVSEESSGKICAQALSDKEPGIQYSSLVNVDPAVLKKENPNLQQIGVTLAYTTFGEPFTKWAEFPVVPADYEFAKMWWEEALKLLASRKITLAKPIVNEGGKGLEGTLVGMNLLKNGKVSAGKLVYTL